MADPPRNCDGKLQAAGRIDQRMTAERVLLALLLGGIGVGCVLVLYPFFSALLWAAILVFTTWPVCEWLRLQARLRRGAAAGVMVALTAVVLVLPLALAAPGGADDVNKLRGIIEDALRAGLPGAPDWVYDDPAGRPDVGRSVEPLGGRHQCHGRGAAAVFRHRAGGRPGPSAGPRQRRAAVRAGAVHRVLLLPVRRADRGAPAHHPAPHRRRAGGPTDRGHRRHGARRGLWHPADRDRAGHADRVRAVAVRRAAPGAVGRGGGLPRRAADRRATGVDPCIALADGQWTSRLGHLPGDLWRGRRVGCRTR